MTAGLIEKDFNPTDPINEIEWRYTIRIKLNSKDLTFLSEYRLKNIVNEQYTGCYSILAKTRLDAYLKVKALMESDAFLCAKKVLSLDQYENDHDTIEYDIEVWPNEW